VGVPFGGLWVVSVLIAAGCGTGVAGRAA